MPPFFFNVRDGEHIPDLEGSELADLNAARKEAVRFAAALLGDEAKKFWTTKGWRMDVNDEFGLHLFTLSFAASEAPSVGRAPYNEPGYR